MRLRPLILRKVAIVSRNGGTKRKRKQRSAGRRTKTREYLSTHIWEGKASARGTSRAEIIGGGNAFSAWSGNAYSNDIFRSAVDAIARNAAKLKGSHIIKYRDHEQVTGDCKLNRLLQVEPNPYMSAFDMLYKLFTHYFLYNNAFCVHSEGRTRAMRRRVPLLNPVHAEF